MAFTGDLEHLPIVDIIQLVHTTRKSGIFSIRAGDRESSIVFSNGSIVGANHINDRIRIGSVLVKSGAITVDDLKQALSAANSAAKGVPLMATLMQMGKLKPEDAQRGLRKLVELTVVELMSWTKGTFTFDTEAAVFTSEAAGGIGQDVGVDAQMVLMDALRIFDERERDRATGKEVPSFEALYADVLPEERGGGTKTAGSAITADDLGLADLDRLEKKIPRPAPGMELFDPVAIHRQNIQELLPGFSAEDQEAFVTFLKRSADRKPAPGTLSQQAGKAVVLFSNDALIRHAFMTICKEGRVPVFSTDDERDLERTISQCLSAMRTPMLVLDSPGRSGGFPEETIVQVRDRMRAKFPAIPFLQLAPAEDSAFMLRSYDDGIRVVIPKPQRELSRQTYVQDMIQFLGAFRSVIRGFQERPDDAGRFVKELKKDIRALREISNPSDAAMVMLAAVADMFERAVTFIVRPAELAGERSVGVNTDKSIGPVHADRLKIPLAKPSVFRDAVEKGLSYYGEGGDETVRQFFQQIGRPLSPAFVLLPLIIDRKVIAVVYGDFGQKEATPIQLDILDILAHQVGISLEYALYRRYVAKTSSKA